MKLIRKPKLLKVVEPVKEEEVKAPKETAKEKTKKNKLPPDTYHDEVTPLELVIDETMKLIFTVKRGGELGLPRVDIRQYVTTEAYTGFTKKGINFPLEFMLEFMDKVEELNSECDAKGLE